MNEPKQTQQYWALALAAALVYAAWAMQSPVVRQQTQAAAVQTALIKPLPLPTAPEDNPWAGMDDEELVRGDAEILE